MSGKDTRNGAIPNSRGQSRRLVISSEQRFSPSKETAMTPTLTVPDFSADVLAFAAEKGVTEYLPGVYEMTRRIFPGCPIRVVMRDDPELSYNREIVFEVVVGDQMDGETMFTTSHQWCGDIFRNCPATHVQAFNLDQVVN
jgi:hypothetical protein